MEEATMTHLFLLYLYPTTLIGLVSILIFSYFALTRIRYRYTNPKSPPEAGGAWPLIGHIPLFAATELPHITFSSLSDIYGPIFTVRIGIYPTLVINNWELAKELFTTHDVTISSRPKLTGGKLLGRNYTDFGFAPYGEYWRQMRKITAAELLSNRRLELLKHIRASEVEGSIRELYKLWGENKNVSHQLFVEMKQWFNDINFNVILRMVAGKRYLYGGGEDVEGKEEVRRCQKAMRGFFQLLGQFVMRDAIPFLGWMDLGGIEKLMKTTAKELDCIVGEWLEEHKRRKMDLREEDEQDFMDVLLSVLDGADLEGYDLDTVCKATCLTLITGGTDTTTVTVTWALSLLLNNPIAMKKAQEELDTQVGKERLVNESDIDTLVYLQATVKEILRLYPAGPLAGSREFSETCNVGGYHIQKGTRLVVNLHKIHRDPRVWSDPNGFRPERFLSTHKNVDVKGQDFELIPFGAGRRSCPGINFGVHMTQLILASFLQAFDISTPSDAPVDMSETPGLTVCKATPLEVLLKPRLPAYAYA